MATAATPAYRRALVAALTLASAGPTMGAAPTRHFVFRYDITVRDLPPTARSVSVWMPIPPETPAQRILAIDVHAPIDGTISTERVYANRIWHAHGAPPRSGEPLRITQRVEVVRRAVRVDPAINAIQAPPDNLDLFLRPNRLVPAGKRFERIARARTGGERSAIAIGRRLYDYVRAAMAYDKTGTGWGRGDAVYACDAGKGNCTDFHSLFIALARAVNIPARFRIGFPLPPARGTGTVPGYHCWAEFWLPEYGWVPVDISEADKHPDATDYYFGGLDENRIMYSLGRDIVLPEAEHAKRGPKARQPLNYFIYPYVEVDGRPWNAVTRRVTYEDLP
ncbi:MAG: transglutaminase-like domain-containing protein [Phycisphaerae bacterium]